jgi:hypothetical protein
MICSKATHLDEKVPPLAVVLQAQLEELLQDILCTLIAADKPIRIKEDHVACGKVSMSLCSG